MTEKKLEKRNNRIFWKEWLGFGLMILSGVAIEGIVSQPAEPEAAIFIIPILILLLPILVIGFYFFILKEPKRKIKIIKIVLILPFLLRILSFYVWIPPIEAIFTTPLKFQAEIMEEKALKKGEVDYCFNIGRIPIFSDFIFQGLKDRFIAYLQKDCIVALAKDKSDETICENLGSKRISHARIHSYIGHEANCYTEVAKTEEGSSICEKADPPYYCYREFFLSLEKYKDNLNKCLELCSRYKAFEKFRECLWWTVELDDCFENVALWKENTEFCKAVSWVLEKDKGCIRMVNLLSTEENFRICRNINDEKERRNCINNLAVEKKSIEICRFFPPESFELEDCLRNLAIKTNNQKICEEIKTGWVRADCKKKVLEQIY